MLNHLSALSLSLVIVTFSSRNSYSDQRNSYSDQKGKQIKETENHLLF